MWAKATMLIAILLANAFMCGCGGGNAGGGGGVSPTSPPMISTTAAQNGALIVSMASATPGAAIYYTIDGSAPGTSSQQYQAPFLVASNLTLKAIATAAGTANSTVTSQSFTPNIPSGTLVWSDEFTNSTGAVAQPDPKLWTYDTGNSGFGNHELENYCAWGSSASPCSIANPNAFVGTSMISKSQEETEVSFHLEESRFEA